MEPLIFVAKKGDRAGLMALNILEKWGHSVKIVGDGDIAPSNSVALFTVEKGIRNKHLRCASHTLFQVAPNWTNRTPFLVGIKPDRTEDQLKVALDDLARSYRIWQPGVGVIRCPWGNEPLKKIVFFNKWVENVAATTGTSHLFSVMGCFQTKKRFKKNLQEGLSHSKFVVDLNLDLNTWLNFVELIRGGGQIKIVAFLCPLFGEGNIIESKLVADPKNLENFPPFFNKLHALIDIARFVNSIFAMELTVVFADRLLITNEDKNFVDGVLNKQFTFYRDLLERELIGINYHFTRFSLCDGLGLPQFINPNQPISGVTAKGLFCQKRRIAPLDLDRWQTSNCLDSIYQQWGPVGIDLLSGYDAVGDYFSQKVDILLSIERYLKLHQAYRINSKSSLKNKLIIQINTE